MCYENKTLKNKESIINILFYKSLEYHDVGKKNPYFQSFVNNKDFISYKFNNINKYHTEISTICYLIDIYKNFILNIKNRKLQIYIKDITIGFAYNIYRHHLILEDLDKKVFIGNMKRYYQTNKEQFINNDITEKDLIILNKYYNDANKITYKNPYIYYWLNKMSYSILIACDYMAVYTNSHNDNFPINYINRKISNCIKNKFYNNDIIKNIHNYKTNKNIPLSKLNKLRTEMFLESEELLIKNKNNSNIFYLEAPTGSGKTLMSLNLALNLLDNTINKIYEVAPYNNIIEQSTKTVKNNFYSNAVLVNAKENIFLDYNEDIINPNYDKALLNYQMLNYPVTLISHVRFFDVLFSNSRIKSIMLPLLCNSVVILDEIQSYKNNLWIHIINSLKETAEIFNIKFIIMSATLPKMRQLLEDKTYNMIDLIINNNKYYEVFKQRIHCNFNLLKINKNTIDEVYNKIKEIIEEDINRHRILIECLTQKTANEIYNKLVKFREKDFLIFQINGVTNNKTRNYFISKIQDKKENGEYVNKKVILIGTQCIESGIDIDMDIGFKDISIIDADEQFCGRINRNFKSKGTVYFFDIDNEENIYGEDYRLQYSLKNSHIQKLFVNKDFKRFYDNTYIWLWEKRYDDYTKYKDAIGNLQYEKINKIMKLINNETYKFLFNCTYKDNISAKELWIEYNNINKNDTMLYPEKIIKLSTIKKKLSKYIYNINTYNFHDSIGVKQENNIYIIDEGYKYFDHINKDNSLNAESILNVEAFVNHVQLFI